MGVIAGVCVLNSLHTKNQHTKTESLICSLFYGALACTSFALTVERYKVQRKEEQKVREEEQKQTDILQHKNHILQTYGIPGGFAQLEIDIANAKADTERTQSLLTQQQQKVDELTRARELVTEIVKEQQEKASALEQRRTYLEAIE